MNNWKKTGLLTALILLAVLAGLIYILDINISMPPSDIEFSPGQVLREINSEYSGERPKNIILFIADGMGFSHLSLALLTQQSENTPSVWHNFDVKGWHDARSNYGPLTDSEASATAIATGTSTFFGFIGIAQNGDTLKNAFEIASDHQYNTAIVTDSYIWDGTPAAFVAHTKSEDDARDILTQIASSSLNLLFGELEDIGEGEVPSKEETIEILERRFQFLDKSLNLPDPDSRHTPVAAIFAEDEIQDLNSSPNLTQLTDVALKYLSFQDKPFVLLVESEEMDAASHDNDSERVINGLKSIQETISLLLSFAKSQGETLILFTSDHETGGLAAVSDFGSYPKLQIRWSTKDHTGAVIPLLAKGPGAEYFADIQRNWEIGDRLISLISQVNGTYE